MSKKKKIHFIALGGSVMHALAISLKKSNAYEITGSDDIFFSPSKDLLAENNLLPDKIGYFEENITPEIDIVILGMHAKKNNVELVKAQKLGLNVQSFPQFIAHFSADKQRVVVSGSHGKSTIVALFIHLLSYHHKSFDYLSGASPKVNIPNVKLSKESPIIIIEGDEYFSSCIDPQPKFFHYAPHILIVTGISWDHINVFPTEKEYCDAFRQLISHLDKGASLVYNKRDKILQKMAKSLIHEDVTPTPYQEHKATISKNTTYLTTKNEKIPLEIFGKHNLSNLSAVLEVCLNIGITKSMFYEAIQSFKGAYKRLTRLKLRSKYESIKNSRTYLDFSHSPSKVAATVNAVRKQFPKHTLNCFLELHTFSSLNPDFIVNYKDTLKQVNNAFVYINPIVLKKKGGENIINSPILNKAFNLRNLNYLTNLDSMIQNINELQSHENSITLIMSSGNVDQLLDRIDASIPT